VNPSLSYREASVAGASPVRLVILLYEQAIEDLRRALAAHARSDIEGRTGELNHAILVIGHLQATLDHEKGGKVAENLMRFYEQVRGKLVEAQCQQSAAGIEQQLAHLMEVRHAWFTVERQLAPTSKDGKPAVQAESGAGWKA